MLYPLASTRDATPPKFKMKIQKMNVYCIDILIEELDQILIQYQIVLLMSVFMSLKLQGYLCLQMHVENLFTQLLMS